MCIWPGTSAACFWRRSRWITTRPNCSDRSQQFPRSEAFRIALGVDAGGGPRRVELRVVPHRSPAYRAAGNQTELRRAGLPLAGRAMVAPRCRRDGAHYFGTALDQPRVILKAFVPWHQLGLAGPPRRAGCGSRSGSRRSTARNGCRATVLPSRDRDGRIRRAGRRSGWAATRRRTGSAESPRARLRNAPIEPLPCVRVARARLRGPGT